MNELSVIESLSGALSAVDSLSGTLSAADSLSGTLSADVVVADPYTGDYTVVPKTNSDVTLYTDGKSMTDNVTIKKIPYHANDNLADGLTVYIGSEIEYAD